MTEVKEELNMLQFVTQYDIKQSTSLLESIRFLMSEGKSSKAVITFINKQVSKGISKEQAFEMLIKIIPDCNQTVLDENAKTWVTYAVSKHKEEMIAACRYQILVELYHRCHRNQEFYKSIVTNLLSKIVDTCIWAHPKSAEAQHALNCLYFTMKYFPSACIGDKRRIEEYVLQFLDSPSKIVTIVEAAKCYHILNQIGGAGPNGTIHIKNFQDNFEKLYKTLSVLYDAMFENINEFRDAPEDITNVIKFKDIPTYLGTMDVYKILTRRMANIVIFLIQMLQTDYKLKKTIKPEILLVIQRGLDIHVHGDENDPNRVLFHQNIQQHQIDLLFLLKALIQSLQSNFMRHSTIKMLFRYLARVTDCTCYNVNSFYKSTIYDVIKYWLQCSGEQIDAKTLEKLIEIIIKDITPSKATLVLQINVNNNSKSKSTNNKTSTASTTTATAANEEKDTPRVQQTQVANCQSALGLLETLFKSVHLNIKKTICTQLFHIITSTLLDISANYICLPYTEQKSRLGLYKVLVAIFDQPTYTIDIDLAVNILALAQAGDDFEITSVCQQGLKAIEKIVHPIHAPIGQSQTITENNEEQQEKQPESGAIKVLSNFLIQCNQNDDDESLKESDNITNDSKSDKLDETAESVKSLPVVEISDNEAVEDLSIVSDVTEEPASKKRKADNQEVIYTFDISQGEGEDPLDSFVDEVN